MDHPHPDSAAKRSPRDASSDAPCRVRVRVRDLEATEIRSFLGRFLRWPSPALLGPESRG